MKDERVVATLLEDLKAQTTTIAEITAVEELELKLLGRFIDRVTGEEWRNVKGFEGFYKISSFGNIKSIARGGEEHIIKSHFTKKGLRKPER